MDKKERNKGGRPKISRLEKSKYEVKCYLKYSEKLVFDEYKKNNKLKASEVVRNSVLKEIKITTRTTTKLTPKILEVMTEIRRANNTLNQVAKLLNTGLQLDGRQTLDYLKLVNSIKKQTNEILNEIKK